MHENVGYYSDSFAGNSQTHRAVSASGDLLFWTLEELLGSKGVDCSADISYRWSLIVLFDFFI